MKNYSYLLALSLGLIQIGTAQANWGRYTSTEPVAIQYPVTIDVPESRPALQSIQNAHMKLVEEFNQSINSIKSMKSTPKSRQDFTRLYHLVKESYTPLISNAADQTTQDALKTESKKITETYQSTVKSL